MSLTKSQVLKSFGQRRYMQSASGVRLQSLLASEMRDVRQWLVDKKGEVIASHVHAIDVALLAKCAVEDDGTIMFSIEEALRLDGKLTALIGKECREFTGFDKDADFKDIEDAAKNSETTNANTCSAG